MKSITILILTTILFMTVVSASASNSKTIRSDSYSIPLSNGISLQMTVADFDVKKHQIKKCQILGWSAICLIDAKPVFGTDWELPINQLIDATVKIGTNMIKLDVSCMYNPFLGKPDRRNFNVEEIEGGYTIHGSFSDGAGSYEAEWVIIGNSSVRTKLQKSIDTEAN